MFRKLRSFMLLLLILVLLGLGGWLWYSQLDEARKRYIQNLVRQIPDLPGRYVIYSKFFIRSQHKRALLHPDLRRR